MVKRPRRRRCGARTRGDPRARRHGTAQDRALREGRLSQFLRTSSYCKNWALPGSKRCRLHGGLSTGPTTLEGMARTIAAMKAGRLRWLAQLKSEGKPIPCGRRKGGRNAPPEERERAAYVRECERKYRDMVRRGRSERKVRRAQRRQEREDARRRMEEHARRKSRMDVGLPYWTPEEWEKL
jgi:hypothetical protein